MAGDVIGVELEDVHLAGAGRSDSRRLLLEIPVPSCGQHHNPAGGEVGDSGHADLTATAEQEDHTTSERPLPISHHVSVAAAPPTTGPTSPRSEVLDRLDRERGGQSVRAHLQPVLASSYVLHQVFEGSPGCRVVLLEGGEPQPLVHERRHHLAEAVVEVDDVRRGQRLLVVHIARGLREVHALRLEVGVVDDEQPVGTGVGEDQSTG